MVFSKLATNSMWRLRVISLTALLFSTQAAQADESVVSIYDWLTLGNKSGELLVRMPAANTYQVQFEFNDRGRGPKIEEQITLTETGLIASHEITGHAYMGAPIAETFYTRNGRAQWQSKIEQGSEDADPNRIWLSANGTPYAFAKLAKFLLSQPDGRAQAWPQGELAVQPLARLNIEKDDESRTILLHAITGIGFTPSYLWLDENNELFGVAYGWMGMTPQGWNHVIDRMQETQDAAEKRYLMNLSDSASQNLPERTIIAGTSVVDVANGTLLNDCDVVIRSAVIAAVSCGDQPLSAGEGLVIDGKGLTLIPGLWDMHAHVSMIDGLLNIAAGVTSVRDMANEHDALMENRSLFDTGKVIGPHVYFAGFVDRTGPYSAPTGKLADNLEEVLEYINWYAQNDYQQIKIYSSIEPAWVPDIAQAAHAAGMRLGGHIPSFMSAEQAVLDGFDEIQHINFVFLNFLAGPEDDTRTPLRFSLVAERAHELDLTSSEVQSFIKLLQQKDVTVDTTATIFRSMFLNRAGELDPSYAMIADHLPADVRRGFLSSELDITEDNEGTYRASADALLKMIKQLYDAGVTLVAGTDAIAGFTLHRELELYEMAGISSAEVLRIATQGAAGVARAGRHTGQIKVGRTADLVLLEENPLDGISAVRKARWVIKGGKLYDPAAIHRKLGIRPFVETRQ